MIEIWLPANPAEMPSEKLFWLVTHRVLSMQMRRPLAFLLILFFVLGPLQGVLEASDDSRLPACCRRNGAHHCAMSEDMKAALEQATGSTPAFSAPATCSSFPGFVFGILTAPHALASQEASTPELLERSFAPNAINTVARTTPVGIRAGRAPPAEI